MTEDYLDPDALTAIFDQFAIPLYKYVMRHCQEPNVGDNIVGDTFAQLLNQFAAGEGHRDNLRAHIYQIAYECIGRYWNDDRLYSSEPTIIVSGEPDNTLIQPQADRSTPDPEEALFSALGDGLTEDQRQVMSLYFVEDFSMKDTAKILSKRVNQIRTSLSDIRKVMDNHPELPVELFTSKKRRRKSK